MFLIAKHIEIDAAHRIPDHHSKCRGLHGHRYRVEAICSGEAAVSGPQRGMAGGLDFGFLKEEMVEIIDKPCDHGLILAFNDPLIAFLPIQKHDLVGKVYMVEEPPTAEYLAQHWYELLKPRVAQRSMGFAKLVAIKVNETPTCWAMYPATVITSEVLHSR